MNLKDIKRGWVCIWNEARHAASVLAMYLASSVGIRLDREVVLCDCE